MYNTYQNCICICAYAVSFRLRPSQQYKYTQNVEVEPLESSVWILSCWRLRPLVKTRILFIYLYCDLCVCSFGVVWGALMICKWNFLLWQIEYLFFTYKSKMDDGSEFFIHPLRPGSHRITLSLLVHQLGKPIAIKNLYQYCRPSNKVV